MSPCERVKQLISEGWKVIDVREPQEFTNGHIEGAENVSLSDVPRLPADGKYLLYCRSGSRSGAAEQFLKSNGIRAVNIGSIHQFIGCLR